MISDQGMSDTDVIKMYFEFDSSKSYDWIYEILDKKTRETLLICFLRGATQEEVIKDSTLMGYELRHDKDLTVEVAYLCPMTQSMFDEFYKPFIDRGYSVNDYIKLLCCRGVYSGL